MKNAIKINIDESQNTFELIGNLSELIKNSRLSLSFKRLNYQISGDKIIIPFQTETKISILQEIEYLLDKFNIIRSLSDETKENVVSYNREQELFTEFSEKARKIRNDEFRENPELVKEFKDFERVVKAKLIRRLYPLQLLSSFHLTFAQNACNFAVPGAGKTSIVYAAYAYLKNLPINDPRHIDKILVIGPISSFAPWEKEYFECFGTFPKSQRLSGDSKIKKEKKKQHLYSGNPSELTLIFHGGVESLQKEITDFLKKNKVMVVVDEAHRIKNPEGVWGKSIVEIAKEAKARIVLTGTPLPNGYEDIYNIYQFIYPYKFKEILGFHYENLIDMTKHNNSESERVKTLIKNVSPYFIRIKKRDLNLPPTTERIIKIEMDNSQREIYDFVEAKYIKSFERNYSATIKDVINKAKLIRLRQASTNPELLLKTIEETMNEEDFYSGFFGNLKGIEEFQDDSDILKKIQNYSKKNIPPKFIKIKKLYLENIAPRKEKVIIWTIFVQNAKELKKYLEAYKIESKLLIGEVEQSERESIIEKFNNPENNEFLVVIANPFSVAESISLHKGCHNAIYMERDYNSSNFLQSRDRIHRVGLLKNQVTNYYYLVSENSIDEVINDKLKLKIERMEKIIDEEIPLFARINDSDETDLIKALIDDYVRRV